MTQGQKVLDCACLSSSWIESGPIVSTFADKGSNIMKRLSKLMSVILFGVVCGMPAFAQQGGGGGGQGGGGGAGGTGTDGSILGVARYSAEQRQLADAVAIRRKSGSCKGAFCNAPPQGQDKQRLQQASSDPCDGPIFITPGSTSGVAYYKCRERL
jgi:hypothetical protein